MPLIVLFLLVVFILIVLFTRIKIVPQSNIYVVERLGKFYAAWETGVHFLCPFLDRVAKRVSIKEQVVDFKPQPVITKDNVTMQIDTVVFFQITNPVQFAYGVERPLAAIENLTATTLRNIIGELEFDATLNSRDLINTKITETIDHATDRWGIKVIRVELKNIDPPVDIKNAMEKQMKAEREKREKSSVQKVKRNIKSRLHRVNRKQRYFVQKPTKRQPSCMQKQKRKQPSCEAKPSRNRKSGLQTVKHVRLKWFSRHWQTAWCS